MPKLKTIYICENCTHTQSKWAGQCPQCQKWNTFQEDVIEQKPKNEIIKTADYAVKPDILNTNNFIITRFKTNIYECDRVLGGGIVADSFTLLTGDPGIGKSTLALQIAKNIAEKEKKVLYISGEESIYQISDRAKRLGLTTAEKLLLVNETYLEKIAATITQEKPEIAIIDSIQVLYSPEIPGISGSMNQIRFAAENLMRIAKEQGIAIIIIGHVTKDGTLAGPMYLSHLVDTVLYLEGDKYGQFRILRGQKNRFGTTSEIGVFEMEENGLIEVKNPSASFLEGRQENSLGSVITAPLEGNRAFLTEVQALSTYTKFGNPKRTTSGYDLNRLQLMIAVLDKYANMKLDSQDIFINIIGGLKIADRATDLAICMALVSSKLKKPLNAQTLILGEVGLSGEIRSVNRLEIRIKEAKKMGFKQFIIPKSKQKLKSILKNEILEITCITQIIKKLFI